jgi:hypothetical protein
MRRHLIVLVAVAAVGAGLAVFWRHSIAPGVSPVPVGSDSTLASQLGSQVVDALEKDPEFRREVTEEPGFRPICAARPFGVNSPSGKGGEAETIYAWIYCKWIPEKTDAPIDTHSLMALMAPIAVHLGSNTTYEVPSDGEQYPRSLKKIFPSSLLEAAKHGNPPAMEPELDKRISQILPTSPSPSST